jgi:putative Mn2+ efflux pump MntP
MSRLKLRISTAFFFASKGNQNDTTVTKTYPKQNSNDISAVAMAIDLSLLRWSVGLLTIATIGVSAALSVSSALVTVSAATCISVISHSLLNQTQEKYLPLMPA